MKIWFVQPPAAEDGLPVAGIEVGRYAPLPAEAGDDAVVAVSAGFDAQETDADVAAWLIPAGLSGDPKLVGRAGATGKPIMLAINGLGHKTYAAARDALPTGSLINLFDARDQDSVAYLEQLAWLGAQPAPFGVMTRSSVKMVEAAAMGADHLIVPESTDIDLAAIARIVTARSASGARPTSAAEIDHLLGREASLTVTEPLAAGHMLGDGDLAVAPTATRGLSPSLEGSIVGRVLRYDIAPGEPLTFGHLMVKDFL